VRGLGGVGGMRRAGNSVDVMGGLFPAARGGQGAKLVSPITTSRSRSAELIAKIPRPFTSPDLSRRAYSYFAKKGYSHFALKQRSLQTKRQLCRLWMTSR